MKIVQIVSSLAVASALAFSTPVFAQNMINGMEIPADRMTDFQQKCEALNVAKAEPVVGLSSEADGTETGAVNNTPEAPADPADPLAQNNLDQLLAGLTPEQCAEAGF